MVSRRYSVVNVEETGRSIVILLVEDNPGDVRLIKEAFEEANTDARLWVLDNGVDALAFLRREGVYDRAPRPDLMLLDLNLPKKDGREVLLEVKGDRNLRRTPVVVLTASEAEEDILKVYDLQANCYVAKPLDLDRFIEVIRSILEFWLTIVKLPSE